MLLGARRCLALSGPVLLPATLLSLTRPPPLSPSPPLQVPAGVHQHGGDVRPGAATAAAGGGGAWCVCVCVCVCVYMCVAGGWMGIGSGRGAAVVLRTGVQLCHLCARVGACRCVQACRCRCYSALTRPVNLPPPSLLPLLLLPLPPPPPPPLSPSSSPSFSPPPSGPAGGSGPRHTGVAAARGHGAEPGGTGGAGAGGREGGRGGGLRGLRGLQRWLKERYRMH
mgnify:CR=1 FL=1